MNANFLKNLVCPKCGKPLVRVSDKRRRPFECRNSACPVIEIQFDIAFDPTLKCKKDGVPHV